jgi:hypothetical protein
VATWTFLTNHGRTLLCIARDPEVRLRDIAAELGITERHAYGIVNDLAVAGYVVKEREGRRNRYHVQDHLPLPENGHGHQAIGDVLDALTETRRVRVGTKGSTKPRSKASPTAGVIAAKKPARSTVR